MHGKNDKLDSLKFKNLQSGESQLKDWKDKPQTGRQQKQMYM